MQISLYKKKMHLKIKIKIYRLIKLVLLVFLVVYFINMINVVPCKGLNDELRTMSFFESLRRDSTKSNLSKLIDRQLWLSEEYPELTKKVVAGFCMEGCIYEFSPDARDANFAGGLGIYFTDWLEGADMIGLNTMGFMPLYSKRKIQCIVKGRQDFVEEEVSYDNQPLEELKDKDGRPLVLEVWAWDENNFTENKRFEVKVYKVKRRGPSTLYLFWCPEVFDFLYPTDRNRRFLQEVIYGKSVYELFKRLGITPDILHFNEGHTGFALIALSQLKGFDQSVKIYVNHSTVEAALERFNLDTLLNGDYNRIRYLGFPGPQYMDLWQTFLRHTKDGYTLDMSLGLLKLTDIAVGVSSTHARWTRELFYNLTNEEYPIIGVLNGAGAFWTDVRDEEDIQEKHKRGKEFAFRLIKERVADLENKEGERIKVNLDPHKPTVWMVRRLVDYKSQYQILKDIIHVICADRGEEVETKWGKMDGLGMQVVVGGVGNEIWVEEFVSWMQRPELKGRFVFVPGGGSELLKAQAQGADIIINSPLPKKEACGTSHMRGARSGIINIDSHSGGGLEDNSFLQHKKSGFKFGYPGDDDKTYLEEGPKRLLFWLRVCSDMYYKKPKKWKQMMKEAYRLSKDVTSEAMVKRYVRDAYLAGIWAKELKGLVKKISNKPASQSSVPPQRIYLVGNNGANKVLLSNLIKRIVTNGNYVINYALPIKKIDNTWHIYEKDDGIYVNADRIPLKFLKLFVIHPQRLLGHPDLGNNFFYKQGLSNI